MSDEDPLKQKEENAKKSTDASDEEFWKTIVEKLSRESSSEASSETNKLQQGSTKQKEVEANSPTDIPDEEFWKVITKDLSKGSSPEVNNETKEPLSEANEIKKPLPEANDRLNELRQRLELILVARLPEKKAMGFIKQLRTCSSEEELKVEAKAIVKKITLIVDVSIGRELLAALYY